MFRAAALFPLLLAATILASPVSKLASIRTWENRIINGEDAKQGEFPSQVSVQYSREHMCGGSVVNEYWVLTAAHCAYDISAEEMTIYVGSIDLGSSGTYHMVDQIHTHEGYPGLLFENDIALVKVKTPFNIDGVNVKAVTLPAQGQSPAEGSEATVIGWGSLMEGGEGPKRLQKVDIEIFSQEKCKEVYKDVGIHVTQGNVCGHFTGDARGACHGDSGSPLFVDGVIVGVVNGGLKCAFIDWPSVYARVDNYADWIQQHIA